MIEADSSKLLKMHSIFMPEQFKRRLEFDKENGRFVHYTSAANALNILKTRQIWMRNAICMNDYMEIEHGLKHLLGYFGTNRQNFFETFDECCTGAAKEAVSMFDEHFKNFKSETYISCFSEHQSTEDQLGRLSMWRAYGAHSVGVAIVIKRQPFYIQENVGVISSPVIYRDQAHLMDEMAQILTLVKSNIDLIASIPRDDLKNTIFSMLLSFVVGSKHPGFAEEREWRVIHLPSVFPDCGILSKDVEVISGVPQIVQKLHLKDNTKIGFSGVEPNDLIDRIIIGPSTYPYTVFRAFCDEMEKCGISEPEQRIQISSIPLRT